MSTDRLLALYGVVPAEPPERRHSDEDRNPVGFGCGMIHWVRVHRDDAGKTSVAHLGESLHWTPVSMLNELMHTKHHAAVCFGAHHHDLPILVAAAVPELAGPYLTDPSPEEAYMYGLKMMAMRMRGAPLMLIRMDSPFAGSLPWWRKWRAILIGKLLRPHGYRNGMTLANILGPWLAGARSHHHAVPPGTVGLELNRDELLQQLRAETLDPSAVWGELVGHPQAVTLEDVRSGINAAASSPWLPPYLVDGVPMTAASRGRHWKAGNLWLVVESLRVDLGITMHALHHGLNGKVIGTNKIDRTTDNQDRPLNTAAIASELHGSGGGLFRYHLPTADFWDRIEAITKTRRP